MFALLCCAPDPEPVARLLRRRARETPAGPQPSLINRTVAPHGQEPRTELRVVLDSPAAAAWAVLDAVRAGADRIAVGAGPVILDGEQADGVGLGRARRAFDEGPGIRVQGADPVLDEAAAALLELAVATSGDYRRAFEHGGRRYPHTIDGSTGRPVRAFKISER